MIRKKHYPIYSPRIRPTLRIRRGLPDFTPFIGLFFLLLIFFLLSSSFIQVTGIPVILPDVQVKGSFGAKKIVATVDAKGNIYFRDQILPDLNEFKNQLVQEVNKSRGHLTMLLSADTSADFGVVAGVMAAAESLNVNLIIRTGSPAHDRAGNLFTEQTE